LRETHLSTKYSASVKKAWISEPHEHSRWSSHPQIPSGQGPSSAVGLIGHISQRATFARLSNEGTYVRSDALWCRFVVDPNLSIPHMGYAIGRQIGGAVVRNRLRRRLRAIMKTHATDMSPGWYLIGVSEAVRTFGFAQLVSNATRLIRAIQTNAVQKQIQ